MFWHRKTMKLWLHHQKSNHTLAHLDLRSDCNCNILSNEGKTWQNNHEQRMTFACWESHDTCISTYDTNQVVKKPSQPRVRHVKMLPWAFVARGLCLRGGFYLGTLATSVEVENEPRANDHWHKRTNMNQLNDVYHLYTPLGENQWLRAYTQFANPKGNNVGCCLQWAAQNCWFRNYNMVNELNERLA